MEEIIKNIKYDSYHWSRSNIRDRGQLKRMVFSRNDFCEGCLKGDACLYSLFLFRTYHLFNYNVRNGDAATFAQPR